MADTDRDPDGKPIKSGPALKEAKTEPVAPMDSGNVKPARIVGAKSLGTGG